GGPSRARHNLVEVASAGPVRSPCGAARRSAGAGCFQGNGKGGDHGVTFGVSGVTARSGGVVRSGPPFCSRGLPGESAARLLPDRAGWGSFQVTLPIAGAKRGSRGDQGPACAGPRGRGAPGPPAVPPPAAPARRQHRPGLLAPVAASAVRLIPTGKRFK